MIKAIIIDDESGARVTLRALIEEYCTEIEIIGECGSVPEGAMMINKKNPDLVFLDIEMPEYNGFELFDFFKDVSFEVIFVTAYSQYAIRAFEVSAIDYILKPVEVDALKNAVEKVKEKKEQANIIQRLELMKDAYEENEIRKIAFPMNDGLLFTDLNDIILFEADRAYTQVYLKNGSKITVSKPMRTFEELLSDKPQFFRPHRSFLININFIKKYQKGESTLIMENGLLVAISREKKQDFEELLRSLRLSI